jgi:hypothetical protein
VDPPHDQRYDDDGGCGEGGTSSQGPLNGGVRVTGEVAEQHHAAAPDDAAGGVVDQEPGIAHLGGSGQSQHDGSEEGHEPAQEHRRTALASQELPGPVQPFPAAAQHPAGHQTWPEVAPNFVANAVADNCRCHHAHHHHRQRGVPQTGCHSAEHGGGLPGHDEPHGQGVFDEDPPAVPL